GAGCDRPSGCARGGRARGHQRVSAPGSGALVLFTTSIHGTEDREMMKRCSGALRRLAAAGFVAALLLLAGAPDAAAQEALYSPAELSTLPKIAAPGKVKSL